MKGFKVINFILGFVAIIVFLAMFIMLDSFTFTKKTADLKGRQAMERYCEIQKIPCEKFETNGASFISDINHWSVRYYDKTSSHGVSFLIPKYGFFIQTSSHVDEEPWENRLSEGAEILRDDGFTRIAKLPESQDDSETAPSWENILPPDYTVIEDENGVVKIVKEGQGKQ